MKGTGGSKGVEEGHVGRLVEKYDMCVLAGKGIKSCEHNICHGSPVAPPDHDDDGTTINNDIESPTTNDN